MSLQLVDPQSTANEINADEDNATMSLQLVDPQSTANEMVEFTTVMSAMSGDMIEKLFAIEAVLLQMPQVELPIRHCFGNKVYVREMTSPKGTIIIGKMHKYKQVNIVVKGDISVLTEDGWKRMKSGEMFESPAGIKRAGFTHEDTVWTTICGTEETDPDKAIEELTIGSYQEFLQCKGDLLWLPPSPL